MGNSEPGSAWKCGTCKERPNECYLHNFLVEMPDLNLRNPDVMDEIKVNIAFYHLDQVISFDLGNQIDRLRFLDYCQFQEIFKHWLEKKAVLGFHIGNIDLLFEDNDNTNTIAPDFNATVGFLNELHALTIEMSEKDGLDR